MINAKELRIGNLFQDKYSKAIIKVNGITENDIFFSGNFTKEWQAEPIPLTEEKLLKLGFIKDEILGFYRNDKSNSTIIIDYDFICLLGYSHVKLDYVHQLQNLYFDLNKKELKL
jgi:hypothetical protein